MAKLRVTGWGKGVPHHPYITGMEILRFFFSQLRREWSSVVLIENTAPPNMSVFVLLYSGVSICTFLLVKQVNLAPSVLWKQ